MGVQIDENRMGVVTLTIDPATVNTITAAEQTFTLPGLKVGDWVWINKPTNTTGVGISGCRVSAANTLAISFVNPTAGNVDPASEVYSIFWFRPEKTYANVVPAL